MNLKVMLVDDEPIIMTGLQKLIDWEAEGYEIVKTASNGMEAIEYLNKAKVDLIITDIRMPEMDGLSMIKTIKEKAISDAYIVLLSGYSDFGFAKQAIKFGCSDYILKPIQEKALVDSLRNVAAKKQITIQRQEDRQKLDRLYLEQNILSLLRGKADRSAVEYVRSHMQLSAPVHFVHISLDNISGLKELGDDEVFLLKQRLFEACSAFLNEDADHLLKDIYELEETYDIGFIYCDFMAANRHMDMETFLQDMQSYVESYHPDLKVSLMVGKGVLDINKLSNTYSSACALRTLKGFKERKKVYYYEEEVQANPSKVMICKKSLDRLIAAIEQNNRGDMEESIFEFFGEMESIGTDEKTVSMNVNYLLFQLIHLAVEQDESVNQEEVMQFIGEKISEQGIAPYGQNYLKEFAFEYADYLISLRKNSSRGILQELEREVRENYAENLTLRELSQKYFLNSSYLGQIFRKKYGQSFKDYLCTYRIGVAAKQLLQTDKKISQIAEDVGYHDTDYFISKFIEQMGCTPAKYRRNAGQVI